MHITLYKDRNGEWRWTLYSSNKRKIANAGEGYKRRGPCMRIIKQLFPTVRLEGPTHVNRRVK